MLRYISRRLVFLIFLIFGVTLLVFLISHIPGDPVAANMSQSAMADPEAVAAFKAKWGLDQPLIMQYFTYLKNLLTGDLGVSMRTGNPVIQDLMQFFPATLELSAFAMIIAIVFGILFGVLSAIYRNRPLDHVIRTLSVSGVSIPSFWFALVVLEVFFYVLGWTPGPGRLDARTIMPDGVTGLLIVDTLAAGNFKLLGEALSHLVLPALVLGSFTMGLITRQTRSNLLEVMSQDYIRTARAKGLSERLVVTRHALGNALIPIITVAGMGFCNLLAGMVFVEKVFAWPGIGTYAYNSARSLDFPAICGVALLVAIIYVVMNLIIDILYGVIDPRVRYR